MEHPKKTILYFSNYNDDSSIYPIKQIAKLLEEEGEFKCLFWNDDLSKHVLFELTNKKTTSEHMYNKIEQCDFFILFCSPNIIKSGWVIKEYNTALSLKKTIIPVFIDETHIPDSLKDRQWVRFNPFDIKESLAALKQGIRNEFYGDVKTLKNKIEQYESVETYIGRDPSENIENLNKWSEELKDLLKQNVPPAVLKAFIRNQTIDQERVFMELLLSQLPSVSPDIIYTFCKLFPEHSNAFFSDQKNFPFLESILAMNDGSKLEPFDPILPLKWDNLRSKKWAGSSKELIEMVCQIFSLNEEIAQNLVYNIIIPDMYFVDEKWGIKAKTEQEREKLISKAKDNRRNEIVEYHDPPDFNDESDYIGTPLVRYEYEILLSLGGIPIAFDFKHTAFDITFGVEIQDNHVVKLGLFDADLSFLPEEMFKLKNLKFLNLLENSISSLPENIGNLKSLIYLNLMNNPITSLPDRIGNLTSLTYLNLNSTLLPSLPESIGNLISLKELNSSFSQLTSLPDSIGNLTSLTHLNLVNNQLTSLPDSIGNLTSLTQLSLGSNQLTSLPESIKNLTSLKFLNLDKKLLKKLPENLKKWIKYLKKNKCHVFK